MSATIYDIDEKALKDYRKLAKRNNNDPEDTIRKRLTCIIFSSQQDHLYDQVYLCKFSGFRIIVDHADKKILWLYWLRKDNQGKKPSREQLKNLKSWQKQLL